MRGVDAAEAAGWRFDEAHLGVTLVVYEQLAAAEPAPPFRSARSVAE